MTKSEFQAHYGFTTEDMDRISILIASLDGTDEPRGTIVRISEPRDGNG